MKVKVIRMDEIEELWEAMERVKKAGKWAEAVERIRKLERKREMLEKYRKGR